MTTHPTPSWHGAEPDTPDFRDKLHERYHHLREVAPVNLTPRARALATERLGIDDQVDTYFVTRTGRLKLRRSSLSGGQLIPYFRPDDDGARRSDYQLIAAEDPEGLETMLAQMLGLHRVVRKRREVLLHHNVRIHLDEVEGLGSFLELEAVFDGTPQQQAEQEAKVASMMDQIGITPDDLIGGSYEGLLGGDR